MEAEAARRLAAGLLTIISQSFIFTEELSHSFLVWVSSVPLNALVETFGQGSFLGTSLSLGRRLEGNWTRLVTLVQLPSLNPWTSR